MIKKILYLTHEYEHGGGVATVVRNLTTNLDKDDFAIDVLIKKYNDSKITLVSSKDEPKKYDSIEQALEGKKYDLMHIHSVSISDTYNGGLSDAMKHVNGSVIYTCHSVVAHEIARNAEKYAKETDNNPEKVKNDWLNGEGAKRDCRAQEQLLSLADRVINMTESGKETLLKYYPEIKEKCITVPNGTDEPKEEDTQRKQFEHQINLLYVGRFAQEKGVKDLSDALANWLPKHANCRVKLVGAGEQLEYMHQKLKTASDQVEFTGWLSGKALDDAYKWADYVVVPSYTESFGIVPLEAMKHKRPVIVTDTDALNELYVQTKTAIPINFKDQKSFAKEIQKSLNTAISERISSAKKYKMDDMVERAYDLVKNKYTWNKVAGTTRALYNSLLDGKPEVSVIIPVIGDTQYLDHCMASLLNQTHENYEIILVADKNNFEKINAYARNPKVRTCQSEPNKIIARNAGIAKARGEYITVMDTKDMALPSRLEILANKLKKSDAGLVHARSTSVDTKGNATYSEIDRYFAMVHANKRFNKQRLFQDGSFINSSTVMMRKSVLQKARGYQGTEDTIDYDLWLRLSEITDFEFLDDIITQFRVLD